MKSNIYDLRTGEAEIHITCLSGPVEWIRGDEGFGYGNILSHLKSASHQCSQLREKDYGLIVGMNWLQGKSNMQCSVFYTTVF